MKVNKSYLLLLGMLALIVQSSYAQFTQTKKLYYVDAARVKKALKLVIAKSQQFYGYTGNIGGGVGDYIQGTITIGAGNGLTFRDCTVELTDLQGDTTNPTARLYIYDSQRDREVSLTKGNSDLMDNYRIQLDNVDFRRQEADITIRQASAQVQSSGRGLHPPGRVNITADTQNNTITITTDYQIDLTNLLLWVNLWDQAKYESHTDYNYRPPAYLLQPNESTSTTEQNSKS